MQHTVDDADLLAADLDDVSIKQQVNSDAMKETDTVSYTHLTLPTKRIV